MTVETKKPPKTLQNEKFDLEAPQDKYYIIYILFFWLGLVHLLPWSFFTTATKYWMYKFRNTSISDENSELRTSLQAMFSASVLITLQISEVAFLFVGLLFGTLIRLRVRFLGILSIILALFVVLTVFVQINTDSYSWQEGFFAMVMATTAGINAMNAVFTITLYTAVSCFPHHYLASYLTGGGIARIFTSGLQLFSLATGLSVLDSALVYFSMGVFVIATTLVFAIFATGHNAFYLHYIKKYEQVQGEKRVSFKKGKQLLKKIWSSPAILGLMILQVNASPVALVVSEGEGNGVWNDVYFIPVITYLLASFCDLIGRWISFKFIPKIPPYGMVIFSLLRTLLFVPLVMFSNAQPRKHLPVLLPHDYQYIIILVISSMTGAYITSFSSYNIVNLVDKEELKDAYHVNMIVIGVIMAALSFISIVSVDLL